jgi:hypothetical protein
MEIIAMASQLISSKRVASSITKKSIIWPKAIEAKKYINVHVNAKCNKYCFEMSNQKLIG